MSLIEIWAKKAQGLSVKFESSCEMFEGIYELTTSIICISVKPKLNWSGSDSLTTGRSSVLYESNRSCSNRFSLYPAEQSAKTEETKRWISCESSESVNEQGNRINSWGISLRAELKKLMKNLEANILYCRLLINMAHLLLSLFSPLNNLFSVRQLFMRISPILLPLCAFFSPIFFLNQKMNEILLK